MALFTDGPVSSMEELAAQDTQLLNVANVEGIDVTQKLGLAQDELALELATMLSQGNGADEWLWRPQTGIQNVVVTPALKLWHTYRTLEMVYRDANNQLNDRYAGKRDQFHERAKWAYEKLTQIGIGIVTSPVPQAAMPAVNSVAGGLPDGTYYVTMAWLNAAGEEGAAALPVAVSTSVNTLSVEPGKAPEKATGWNVFMGLEPGEMTQQNASAIGIEETWTQPAPLTTTSRAPGQGQAPNYVKPVPRLIQRG